jgi:hypothetical protein
MFSLMELVIEITDGAGEGERMEISQEVAEVVPVSDWSSKELA